VPLATAREPAAERRCGRRRRSATSGGFARFPETFSGALQQPQWPDPPRRADRPRKPAAWEGSVSPLGEQPDQHDREPDASGRLPASAAGPTEFKLMQIQQNVGESMPSGVAYLHLHNAQVTREPPDDRMGKGRAHYYGFCSAGAGFERGQACRPALQVKQEAAHAAAWTCAGGERAAPKTEYFRSRLPGAGCPPDQGGRCGQPRALPGEDRRVAARCNELFRSWSDWGRPGRTRRCGRSRARCRRAHEGPGAPRACRGGRRSTLRSAAAAKRAAVAAAAELEARTRGLARLRPPRGVVRSLRPRGESRG
jgi:hypothetical protein